MYIKINLLRKNASALLRGFCCIQHTAKIYINIMHVYRQFNAPEREKAVSSHGFANVGCIGCESTVVLSAGLQIFSFRDSQIMLIGSRGSFKLTLVLLRLPWRFLSSFFLGVLQYMALVLDRVNSSTYTSAVPRCLVPPPWLLIQMSFETLSRRSKLLRFPWYGVDAYGSSTWPE